MNTVITRDEIEESVLPPVETAKSNNLRNLDKAAKRAKERKRIAAEIRKVKKSLSSLLAARKPGGSTPANGLPSDKLPNKPSKKPEEALADSPNQTLASPWSSALGLSRICMQSWGDEWPLARCDWLRR
eukprot:scaffold989_cov360-Prasinococcus_capsulatus_cf.AAC.1